MGGLERGASAFFKNLKPGRSNLGFKRQGTKVANREMNGDLMWPHSGHMARPPIVAASGQNEVCSGPPTLRVSTQA